MPVLLEEAHGPLGDDAHRDVALAPRRQRLARLVDHVHHEAGAGPAHRTGLDLQRWEVAHEEHGLGLAIAVAYGEARRSVPGRDDLGVQGFARADAVAQRAGPEAREILEHEHPVSRGRGAEGGNGVVLQHAQTGFGVEPAAGVLREDGGALGPRPEEGAPGRLGPAGLRQVPQHVARLQVEPEAAGHGMADRVGGVRV